MLTNDENLEFLKNKIQEVKIAMFSTNIDSIVPILTILLLL